MCKRHALVRGQRQTSRPKCQLHVQNVVTHVQAMAVFKHHITTHLQPDWPWVSSCFARSRLIGGSGFSDLDLLMGGWTGATTPCEMGLVVEGRIVLAYER